MLFQELLRYLSCMGSIARISFRRIFIRILLLSSEDFRAFDKKLMIICMYLLASPLIWEKISCSLTGSWELINFTNFLSAQCFITLNEFSITSCKLKNSSLILKLWFSIYARSSKSSMRFRIISVVCWTVSILLKALLISFLILSMWFN